MSLGPDRLKTEHAGPKNGGGYWGKRAWAKWVSRRKRRRQDRALERGLGGEGTREGRVR